MDDDEALAYPMNSYPTDGNSNPTVVSRIPASPPNDGSLMIGRYIQPTIIWFLGLLIGLEIQATAEGLSPKEAFFEESIRPLLIERCQSCHDGSTQESELRLDTLDGILQGGLSGPAAIAGQPGDSLLIHAITGSRGVERMPPDEPLEENEIALLRRWVAMGLPWTATEDQPGPALGDQTAINALAQTHWAFQPIEHPTPPSVESGPGEALSPVHPIDAFIEQKRAVVGLKANPRANRRDLLRRLFYDVIGLPPTMQEMDGFIFDPRSDADLVEATVDRLLASKHHGERWARYWLDLARYADTRDWQAQAELRYPYAYTYRDYVIESLNADKPYNRFIEEQIAADYYHDQPNAPELAALGFLTVGPLFRNNTLEQAADKIDVVCRGLMGITVSCARCHDHKYDPVPIEDYYSLYGVFASCNIPESLPMIEKSATTPSHPEQKLRAAFEEAVRVKRQDLLDYQEGLRRKAIEDLKSRLPTYLDAFVVMGLEKSKEIRGAKSQFKVEETAMTPLNDALLDRLRRNTDAKDSVLQPWHQSLSIDEESFRQQRARLLADWKANVKLNQTIVDALLDASPKLRSDVVKVYAAVFHQALTETNAENAEILRPLTQPGGWFDLDLQRVSNASRLLGAGRKKLGDLEKAITEVEATHPGAPPRAMVIIDDEKPITPFVLLRGEAARKGDRVPRQFISVLSPPARQPFSDGSGRRELAESITDPRNPLTTRVFVNRVWSKYFGAGLVPSLDDFGLRTAPPSHPELLDYLCSEFMNHGWSMKWLHKTILTSQTYAQSADRFESDLRVDPDNRLLWRQNRRRLDFEAMRDSILCAGGSLETAIGGKSVHLSEEPFTTRRSVYAYIDRIELDPILRTFDFPSPTASAASRPETTVPQQALFGMNHPFVAQQAARIANAVESVETVQAIERIYQKVFARNPTIDEIKVAQQFLRDSAVHSGALGRDVWQYGFGAFRPIDEVSRPVTLFESLNHWTGNFYQVSETYPDPELKFLRLSDVGGHPGEDDQHAIIRRWIAPADGDVNVNGTLKHQRDNGDGVVAAVRCGEVFETFKACRSEAKTLVKRVSVERGDVIDFLVSAGKTVTADSFTWTIVINGVGGPIDGQHWRSNTEFAAPPPPSLTPLGQLAQALMLTNEFLYLD